MGYEPKILPSRIAISSFDNHELDIRYVLSPLSWHRFYLQYKRRIFCSNTGNTGYLAFNGACITNGRDAVLVPEVLF
jgi:hypothetical protein